MKTSLFWFFLFSTYLLAVENKVIIDKHNLPGDETAVYLLERIFSETLVANYDTGSAYLPSTPALSVEGNSQYHTKYYYDTFQINSFLQPGQPLLWLPLDSIKSLEVNEAGVGSLQKRGIRFESKSSAEQFRLSMAGFASVGGPFLTPEGTFDKEPATAWGGPSASNRLFPAGSMQMFLPGNNYNVAAQLLSGRKNDKNNASEIYFTGSGVVTAQLSTREKVFAGISFDQRNNLSAESGSPLEQEGIYASFVNGYSKRNQDEQLTLQLQFETIERSSSSNTMYTEYLDSLDLKNANENGREYSLGLKINYKKQSINLGSWDSYWLFDFVGSSFHRQLEKRINPIYYASKPLWIKESSAVTQDSFQVGFRPAIGASYNRGKTSATVQGGVYLESNYGQENAFLNRAELEGLLRLAYNSNQQNIWYMDFVREAIGNQRLIHDLLHPSGQTINKYFWQDDGDLLFQETEEGALLENQGINSLRVEDSGPSMHEIALGFKSSTGSSLWHFRFLARQTINTWRLFLDESSLENYVVSERLVNDRAVKVYDQTQGYGSNKYVLKGDTEAVNQFGFTLASEKTLSQSFFFGFSFTALFSMGYNRFGLNTYYNDWGITSYSDADPNISNNAQAGRMDQDRSYFAHLYTGYKSNRFAWTSVLQYRDGQPVTRFKVIDGLSQGPAYVQAGSYANGITGIGRTALYLNWDMHFNFDFTQEYSLSFDIFNVLNSRFLTQESLRAGPDYRKPLSIMGERMLKLKLTIKHD
jgi:hypothetical protein